MADAKISAIAFPHESAIEEREGQYFLTDVTSLSLYCYVTDISVNIHSASLKILLEDGVEVSPTSISVSTYKEWILKSKKIGLILFSIPASAIGKKIRGFKVKMSNNTWGDTNEPSFYFNRTDFYGIYKTANGFSESGYIGDKYNYEIKIKNYYSYSPVLEVSSTNKYNNKTNIHSGSITIKWNALTSYKIFDNTSEYSTFRLYYRVKGETDFILLKTDTRQFKNIGYSVGPYILKEELKYKDLEFQLELFSSYQNLLNEEEQGVFSNIVLIEAMPNLNRLSLKNNGLKVRPYYHYKNGNNFIKQQKIDGTFSIIFLDNNSSKYANYLTTPKVYLKNDEEEFEIAQDYIALNFTYGLKLKTDTFLSDDFIKNTSNLKLKYTFTDYFDNSYSVELESIDFIKKEQILFLSGAISTIEVVDTEDQSQIYTKKPLILNPNEKIKYSIDTSKIFIPHREQFVNKIKEYPLQIKIYGCSSQKEQFFIDNKKKLISALDYENLTETFTSRYDDNSIKTTFLSLGFCFFEDGSEKETLSLIVSTDIEENLFYIRLGRIAPMKVGLCKIDGTKLAYSFIDNGGDRNDEYSYETFSNNGQLATSLSRSGKECLKLNLFQVKENIKTQIGNTITLEVNNYFTLDNLRYCLLEKINHELDLSQFNFTKEQLKLVTLIEGFYYYSLDGKSNYISFTYGDTDDEVITIINLRPTIGHRKNGIIINGKPGQALDPDNFIEIYGLDTTKRIIIQYLDNNEQPINNAKATIYFDPIDKKIHLKGFVIDS